VNGRGKNAWAAGMTITSANPVQLNALEGVMAAAIDHMCTRRWPARRSIGTIIDPAALAVLHQLRRPDRPDPVAELKIDLFVQETPERLREMRTAVTQYNAEALAAQPTACGLRASSIGAMRMASLCERLEQNAERAALKSSSRLLKEIETEFEGARQAPTRWSKTNPKPVA